MTILQPHKKITLLTKLLIVLAIPLALEIVYLVMLSNETVNLRHEISKINLEIQKVENDNVEIKDEIFSLFDNQSLADFSQTHALVQEKNPEYLEVNQKWAIVSY
ncbi:MAG: hypothetical protein HYT13_02900 [Candidatus Liptonbacteria bacterium]|nr:hypothetical protein [Candidatus Liptonbacteria bacterium]